ncbi:hypothetical protein PAEPH01_2908 [Pancytospora epiphaga]|nr:hypothetical protein PAEPH01_2908 [Pancytospora epiphaga]
MLDSIQQFPLDANCFERSIRRLNKTYSKYMTKYKKILERMPDLSYPPFLLARRHLEKCLKQKKKVIDNFLRSVKHQINNLEEYNRINGSALEMRRLLPVETSVFQTKDNALLETKNCICGGTDGGLMICCDLPTCQTRWHHLKCIGMATAPSAGWVCEKCKKLEKF